MFAFCAKTQIDSKPIIGKALKQDGKNTAAIDAPVVFLDEDDPKGKQPPATTTDDKGEFTSEDILNGKIIFIKIQLQDTDGMWIGTKRVLVAQIPNRAIVKLAPPPEASSQKGTGAATPHSVLVPMVLVRMARRLPLFALAAPQAGGTSAKADTSPPAARTVSGKLSAGADASDTPANAVLRFDRAGADPVIAAAGSDGKFSVELPTGDYVLTIIAKRYVPVVFVVRLPPTGNVTAFDSQSKSASLDDIALEPDSTRSQEVENARASDVSATRRFLMAGDLIPQLPLAGIRRLDDLVLLAPGVTPAPRVYGSAGPSIGPGLGAAGQFSINGLRSRGNNFTIDGADNNDEEAGVRRQGFASPFPESVDSVAELQVLTALADARYGHGIGGQINTLTKLGSSQWHGTMYGFGTGGALVSRPFFTQRASGYPSVFRSAVPVTSDGTLSGKQVRFALDPTYQGPIQSIQGFGFQENPTKQGDSLGRAQTGLTLAGPLLRKRSLFFFLSFEDQLQNEENQAHFAVPTVAERGLNNSGATGLTSRTPLVGLQGPLYPATLAGNGIFSLFPFPNNPLGPYGGNTYTTQLNQDAHSQVYSAKVDHSFQWLGRQTIGTARYDGTREGNTVGSVGGALASSLRAHSRTQNIVAGLTTAISAPASNELRASLGLTAVDFGPRASPLLLDSDIFQGNQLPQPTKDELPYLLNAPLLINITQPSGGPAYVSAGSIGGMAALASQGLAAEPFRHSESLTGPLGQVNIAGYSPVGLDVYRFPQRRRDHTIQLADVISFHSRRHFAVAGADAREITLGSKIDRNARPLAEFHGVQGPLIGAPIGGDLGSSFNSPASMAALGAPTALFQTLAVSGPETSLPLQRWETDVFIHDYLGLGRLTLNGGIRGQISSLPVDGSGRLTSAFDVSQVETDINEADLLCATYVGPQPTQAQFVDYNALCHQTASSFRAILTKGFNSGFGAGLRTV